MSNNNVPLYTLDSKGKTRTWKANTTLELNSEGYIEINIEHGVLNGKMQTKQRIVKAGKNKGKANETSIEEQAILELERLYTKQKESSYFYNVEDYVLPCKPVLAHKYKDKKHTVKYDEHPYYASNKLNGIRCFVFVSPNSIVYESRTRKPFKDLCHLSYEALNLNLDGFNSSTYILDGELYHPDIPFTIICALVNSSEYVEVKDEDTGKVWKTSDIRLYVYDAIPEDNSLTYEKRFIANKNKFSNNLLHYVEQVKVLNEDHFLKISDDWIAKKLEGGMLRRGDITYEFGIRSINLLKHKVMEQSEFKILNLYLAENDETKVMATLANHYNPSNPLYNTFECSLSGSKADNLLLLQDLKHHIEHSWLTVDFQELSDYDVPLFSVGIAVRKGTTKDGVFYPDV